MSNPITLTGKWLAIYCRHHSSELEPFDTKEEAAAFLENGANEGSLYQVGIFNPNTHKIESVDPLDMFDMLRAGEWLRGQGVEVSL